MFGVWFFLLIHGFRLGLEWCMGLGSRLVHGCTFRFWVGAYV